MLTDGQTFEATLNGGQAVVALGAVALPFGYWWFITVPEARIALAKDKRLGETKEFIAELAESAEGERPVEKWFFSKWLKQDRPRPSPRAAPPRAPDAQAAATSGDAEAGAAAEPSAADGAPPRQPSLAELFEPASLRGNATPAFFSGDNPIVVTMAALMAMCALAAAARANAPLALDAAVLGAGLVFGLTRLTLR